MNTRIPPYQYPTSVTGLVGETIEVTSYAAAGDGRSPATACVIIETTEGDDLISAHLSSTEARWLGSMILAAADAADCDAATKRGRFAGAVAGIEQDMRSAVEAVSRLPPGSGA